jgi:hypothetical protein
MALKDKQEISKQEEREIGVELATDARNMQPTRWPVLRISPRAPLIDESRAKEVVGRVEDVAVNLVAELPRQT